jgi:IS4 transposase
MMLQPIFERFVNDSPATVMTRVTLEHALQADQVDRLFTATAERQYTRELLFSTVVDLMALVVCRIQPSLRAAYQGAQEQIPVTVRALYDKVNHVEPAIAAALVTHVGSQLTPLIQRMGGGRAPLLQGYRVRILDGNHLAGTEHRLKELRPLAAGALPGQSLAVLDPDLQLITHVVCCEDGHAQERAYLDEVVPLIERRDVWIADRNFCVREFLLSIARRLAYFVIRQHGVTFAWEKVGKRKPCGRVETGKVYEQRLRMKDASGGVLEFRRITLVLDKPTRDGDMEIHVLSNLPTRVSAQRIVDLYRKRWTIEIAYQELTTDLKCEPNTLGHPKAALFAYCVALAAYNVLAAVKAALRAVHGEDTVDQEVSNYYLTKEIAGTYRGMMIAIPPEQWSPLAKSSTVQLAALLKRLAKKINLEKLKKHPRGPKKPAPKRRYNKKQPHVSTARLLAARAYGSK